MTRIIVKYLSIILAISIVSVLFDTVHISGAFALLLMGLVLLIVNLLLKPILLIIALPLTILTLGLFSFVINALTIMIADSFVAGINMGGFFNSLLTALIIVIFNNLLMNANQRKSDRL